MNNKISRNKLSNVWGGVDDLMLRTGDDRVLVLDFRNKEDPKIRPDWKLTNEIDTNFVDIQFYKTK